MVFQLIHDTVVDTSIVFPHARGPPFKKGLKKLALDILEKDIQKEGNKDLSSILRMLVK